MKPGVKIPLIIIGFVVFLAWTAHYMAPAFNHK
jgi:hypothetical protein